MISEVVVLLGFLGFLAIRTDYLRRRWALVVAMLFWGTARILMEITFKVEVLTGELRYDWASMTSCVAAACLFFCLLFMFIACMRERSGTPKSADGTAALTQASAPAQPAKSTDPSERIRRLVDHNAKQS